MFAAEEVLGVARRVKQWGLPPNTFLNVNIPVMPAGRLQGLHDHDAGDAAGREGAASPKRSIRRADQSTGTSIKEGGTAPQGTDIWAVSNGYVSVTPMKVGEADPSQMDSLRAIFK